MKLRTNKELNDEIAALSALKTTIPKMTMFGNNNHEKLDAQIEVLEQRMTEKQVEQRFYQDESDDLYQDGDNDLWSNAGDAHRWMIGEEDESPSSGWK